MFINSGRYALVHLVSTLVSAIALATLVAVPASAQPPEKPRAGVGPLSVETAVELALTHNPGLAALDAQSDALGHMPSQAGALPDPVVSLNGLPLDIPRVNPAGTKDRPDVQVGCRRSARVDRARAHHVLYRRTHDDLGAAPVPQRRPIRSFESA